MPFDLHCHSHYSDGTFNPHALVALAKQRDLLGLALTDHDTVAGWPEMEASCHALGIEWLPGVEFSTRWRDREIHLLGFFDPGVYPSLREGLEVLQVRRRQRVLRMLEVLRDAGVADWNPEELVRSMGASTLGRPHVAQALVAHGVCRTVREAFRHYLAQGKVGWVASERPDLEVVLRWGHALGGLLVVAHPKLSVNTHEAIQLARTGVDGLECYHSSHDASEIKKWTHLARQEGLFISGGSDCHGTLHGKPILGGSTLSEEAYSVLCQELKRRYTDRVEAHALTDLCLL